MTFDKESHLKSKVCEEVEESDGSDHSNDEESVESNLSNSENSSDESLNINESPTEDDETLQVNQFKRRFNNIDMSSCWLNSCLQLILTGFDQCVFPVTLNSELGNELKRLKLDKRQACLDPTGIKNILVNTENTRVSLRISELESEIDNLTELQQQVKFVQNLRLDLLSGQQCVKDFFICLKENEISWPDVASIFNFKIINSVECCACNHLTTYETTELFIEIPVPPDNSRLNDFVEEVLNISELHGMYCEACQSFAQKEKRSKLALGCESEFIIVILLRGIETLDGFQLVKNCTSPTDNVFVRYCP